MADLGSNNAWQESGLWWRADLKKTALYFLNFSFLLKYSKKMYGLIIGTVQPSLNTSGRFFLTWTMYICIGLTRQASVWISEVEKVIFVQTAWRSAPICSEEFLFFTPFTSKRHRSPSPATPRKNGLGCK